MQGYFFFKISHNNSSSYSFRRKNIFLLKQQFIVAKQADTSKLEKLVHELQWREYYFKEKFSGNVGTYLELRQAYRECSEAVITPLVFG